jgi:hypothetical protein
VSRSISTSWVSHAPLRACWRTRSAVARDVHADIGSVRRRIGRRIARRSRWASHRRVFAPRRRRWRSAASCVAASVATDRVPARRTAARFAREIPGFGSNQAIRPFAPRRARMHAVAAPCSTAQTGFGAVSDDRRRRTTVLDAVATRLSGRWRVRRDRSYVREACARRAVCRIVVANKTRCRNRSRLRDRPARSDSIKPLRSAPR